jgi:hypothetical protein
MLAALRRDRQGDEEVRSAMRALAREFPGALRELDTLALDEIERRARALADAAERGETEEPWMAWMIAYHATMKAALLIKARIAKRKRLGADAAREVAADASKVSGAIVDEAFVRAVARPPGGRLNRVVFERLAEEFGAAPDHIWEALFPARNPGRYAKRPPG